MFRKSKRTTDFVTNENVVFPQLVESANVNGVSYKTIENVDITKNKESLPDCDEYTLENLLAAGIPLEQVPTVILDPENPSVVNAMIDSFINSQKDINDE